MRNKFVQIVYLLISGILLIVSNLNAQWNKTNNHLNQEVYSITTNKTYLFAGTNGSGVYRSSDDGENWVQINNGLSNLVVNTIITSDSNIIAGTMGGGIFISSNNGNTWIQSNMGLTYKYVISLAKDSNYVFAGTNGAGIFLSTDNGKTWSEKNSGLEYYTIKSIIFSDTNIFVATQYGFNPYMYGDVCRASIHNVNWEITSAGLPEDYVSALTKSGDNLFVAFFDYRSVYKSTDNGDNWHLSNYGLPERMLLSMITYTNNGIHYIFVGNRFYPDPPYPYSQSVCLSNNDGTSWTVVSKGIPNTDVWSFGIKDQYIFAATDSGVYRSPLSEMITSVDNLKDKLPKNFLLFQNYPNPFNPTTTISFRLPIRTFVSLNIYNDLGARITSICSEELSAGLHSFLWNAEGLSSGIYFYQIKAGPFNMTKKLLFLK